MERILNMDKYITGDRTIITPENVKYLGENIALYTLKHLLPYRYKELASLYYGLIKDIKQQEHYERNFTEGYDIAQTAICFLCGYMGKALEDTVIGKYKRPVTIKHACASEIGNYIYKRRLYKNNTYPILKTDKANASEPFTDDETESSYKRAEEIIAGMRLTNKQKLTLDCYLQRMGVSEIARLLSRTPSTVWRSRMILQRKYNELYLN